MLLLTIRTDKPEAELGLFDGDAKLAYLVWPAHRRLAETIHVQIRELLGSQGRELQDLGGIIVFKGPGSFTGLRIGISVANALAYSLDLPIAGATGQDWIARAAELLRVHPGRNPVVPEYGALPNVTPPRQ